MNDNPFLPALARLAEIRDLATGIKLFRCEFIDKGTELHYRPGQFGFLSAIGVGEAPFGLAVSEARSGGLAEFAVQRIGTVTDALHEMQPGDLVGVRGPMGNCFPMDQLKGDKHIIILGGGIGLAPLRPVIQEILDHRDEYGPLELFCAARSPELLVFREEFAEWGAAPRTTMHVTVDKGNEGWTGQVGLITQVLAQVAPSPGNAVAITCGPPIMIKFVLKALAELGFSKEQVFTTMELRMKCGVGKCGRCNIGSKYVCKDGPVFRFDELAELPDEY